MPNTRSSFQTETLESRSLFSGLAYTSNVPAAVTALDGYATAGVALAGGHFLAVGYSPVGTQHQNIYVMYNADGSLDTAFGHGGYAIQSIARSVKIGVIDAVYGLADGSALVQFDQGLRRLTTTGVYDSNFGTNGLYKAYLLATVTQADGTTLAYTNSANNFGMIRLDAHGKVLGSFRKVGYAFPVIGDTTGVTARLQSNSTSISDGETLTLLNNDGTIRNTFGTKGSVNLKLLEYPWLVKHGPWYATNGTTTNLVDGYIYGATQTVTAASDGGVVVDAAVLATSANPKTNPQPQLTTDVMTHLHIHLSATGKLVSINSGGDDRLSTAFYQGDAPTFGGTFHYGTGADQTFVLPNRKGWVDTAVPSTNGGYFLLGATSTDWTGTSNNFTTHFKVAYVKAAGDLTGTLFNDHDRDGIFNAGETVIADREVYIDANNNGQFDAGEEVTYSDAQGRYSFGDVPAGNYVVRRVYPTGFVRTSKTSAVTVTAGVTSMLNIGSAAIV